MVAEKLPSCLLEKAFSKSSGRAVATRSRRALALAAAGECALAAPGRDAGARAGALPQQWALMSAPSPGARLAASSEQRCWLTVDAQGQRVACCNTQKASCPQNAGPRGKSSRAVPSAAAIRPCLLSRHSLGVCSTKVAVASRYLATVQSVISSTSACCNLLQLAFARIQCRARYIRLQCVGSNVMSPAALKEQQSWRPVPVKVCLGTVFFQIA